MTVRAALFALAPALLGLAVVACTKEEGSPTTETEYGAEDFERFALNWTTTGYTESIAIDRDCGVHASNSSASGEQSSGSGVVPSAECAAFATLAVSPEVRAALASAEGCEGGITDDYARWSLRLRDGTELEQNTAGCSATEPYRTLQTRARELVSYATMTKADSGADGAPVDAMDAMDATDADATDACAAVGTFDIATEEMANTICAMTSPCKVCVQSRDDAGAPSQWMALEVPESCPCPAS